MEKEFKELDEMTRREFLGSGAALAGGLICGMTLGNAGVSSAQTAGSKVPIPTLEVTYYAGYPEMMEFWRAATRDFKEIGLEIKHTPLEAPIAAHKMINEHNFGHMGEIWWGPSPERLEPSFYLEELLHSSKTMLRGRNYGHYVNPEYDKVVDAQRTQMDLEKRKDLIWKAQETAAQDHPVWWLYFAPIIQAYNARNWEGVVPMIGNGIGGPFAPWTFLKVRPLTGKKTMRACYVVDVTTLNPLTAHLSPNQQLLRTIYDPFARITPEFKVMPWAAESWKIVDAVTIDLTLRKGMKFHDGKPVTMEDAKFSIDYPKQWQIPLFRHATDIIESVEIRGENILRVNLVKPYAPFFAMTLSWLIILPKHIWKEVPEKYGQKSPMEWENTPCLGSGPFKFGHWRKGAEIFLKANPEHFMAPQIENLIWVVIPSIDGAMGALEKKEIDIIGSRLTPDQGESLKKHAHIKVDVSPSHGPHEARPDIRKKPFDDREFRRAIHHILNKKTMDSFYGGMGVIPNNTPIHPLIKPWHNPNIPMVDFN
ncbi:MAG: ABC transporter substrate-binding protein, partial [Pseudomonadota bacterium]